MSRAPPEGMRRSVTKAMCVVPQGRTGRSSGRPRDGPAAIGTAVCDRPLRVPKDVQPASEPVRPGRRSLPGTNGVALK